MEYSKNIKNIPISKLSKSSFANTKELPKPLASAINEPSTLEKLISESSIKGAPIKTETDVNTDEILKLADAAEEPKKPSKKSYLKYIIIAIVVLAVAYFLIKKK